MYKAYDQQKPATASQENAKAKHWDAKCRCGKEYVGFGIGPDEGLARVLA
jgi:hypothetical protein